MEGLVATLFIAQTFTASVKVNKAHTITICSGTNYDSENPQK